ncbi:MAG: hypothetical protein KDK51_04670 [Deltaproteobacteria bacterium]|nr:hypothetical protein [Deltaproteobacteria bacterium]
MMKLSTLPIFTFLTALLGFISTGMAYDLVCELEIRDTIVSFKDGVPVAKSAIYVDATEQMIATLGRPFAMKPSLRNELPSLRKTARTGDILNKIIDAPATINGFIYRQKWAQLTNRSERDELVLEKKAICFSEAVEVAKKLPFPLHVTWSLFQLGPVFGLRGNVGPEVPGKYNEEIASGSIDYDVRNGIKNQSHYNEMRDGDIRFYTEENIYACAYRLGNETTLFPFEDHMQEDRDSIQFYDTTVLKPVGHGIDQVEEICKKRAIDVLRSQGDICLTHQSLIMYMVKSQQTDIIAETATMPEIPCDSDE